ncbi:MAG: hypothetical protein WAM14_09990 [Candidatus Nitrosopolaris sp.]
MDYKQLYEKALQTIKEKTKKSRNLRIIEKKDFKIMDLEDCREIKDVYSLKCDIVLKTKKIENLEAELAKWRPATNIVN